MREHSRGQNKASMQRQRDPWAQNLFPERNHILIVGPGVIGRPSKGSRANRLHRPLILFQFRLVHAVYAVLARGVPVSSHLLLQKLGELGAFANPQRQ